MGMYDEIVFAEKVAASNNLFSVYQTKQFTDPAMDRYVVTDDMLIERHVYDWKAKKTKKKTFTDPLIINAYTYSVEGGESTVTLVVGGGVVFHIEPKSNWNCSIILNAFCPHCSKMNGIFSIGDNKIKCGFCKTDLKIVAPYQ